MVSKASTDPAHPHAPIRIITTTSPTPWYLYSCCRCHRTRNRSYEKCPACKHQGYCCIHCTFEPAPERWSADTGGLVYEEDEIEKREENRNKSTQSVGEKNEEKDNWARENKKWLEETRGWTPRGERRWIEVPKEKKGSRSSGSWCGCWSIVTYIVLFLVFTSWLGARNNTSERRHLMAENSRENQRQQEQRWAESRREIELRMQRMKADSKRETERWQKSTRSERDQRTRDMIAKSELRVAAWARGDPVTKDMW